MITKNDIVLTAYEELSISGITSSPSPEDIRMAVKRLDMMVLAWQNSGLCLSYVRSEGFNNIDPNQDSGLNDVNAHAVSLNLAKTLAPAFGKPLNPDTRAEARKAYLGLFSSDLTYREADPYQPTGSGHSFGYGYSNRFSYQAKQTNAPDDCETKDIKIGEIDYFTLDFSSYLNEVSGDTIASFTVDDGQGVQVTQSAQEDSNIILEVKGIIKGLAPVKVTVNCSPSGRVNPETINFNVVES
jgi:hypothetical protein